MQFDPTTVGLSRLLRSSQTPDAKRCLEIGVGQGALVSLSVAIHYQSHNKPLEIVGVDCSEKRVKQAQAVALHNNVSTNFFVSDLFSNIPSHQAFDLIFFNPPYVPTTIGKRLKLDQRFSTDGDQVWDGGLDGTEVLVRFLNDARKFLAKDGMIAFGVQSIFVPDNLIREILNKQEWVIQHRVEWRFPPSVCYLVKRP